MRGVTRFTPEVKRANLRKTDSETDNQVYFAQFSAVAQQGHERRMTMQVLFVQRGDFSVCGVRELYRVNDTGRFPSTENSWLSRGSVVPSSTAAGKTQIPCRPLSEGN